MARTITLDKTEYDSMGVQAGRPRNRAQGNPEAPRGPKEKGILGLVPAEASGDPGGPDDGGRLGGWGSGGTRFLQWKYLLDQARSFKVGYIAGVSDAYQNNILDQSDLLKFQRCTRGMTVGQLQAIAEKHLQDKPQFRHDQMAGLVWVAVITSCPQ